MHLIKWLYPGMGFKRWLFVFALGTLCVGLGAALIFNTNTLIRLRRQSSALSIRGRAAMTMGLQ